MIQTVCVYCGSSDQVSQKFITIAADTGRFLVQQGCRVVYGGGGVGLMRALADAVLQAGGTIIGILPNHFYTPELIHPNLTRLEIVPNMHARKARMAELADAFIALPGGFGTWEELFEVLTWAQIGLHRKPIGLINAFGYYDPMLHMIDRALQEGFLQGNHKQLLRVASDIETLWPLLQTPFKKIAKNEGV